VSDYRNNKNRPHGLNNRNTQQNNQPRKDGGRQEKISEALYPCNKAIKDIITQSYSGNFALWYNKFIPVLSPTGNKNYYKPCNNQGKAEDSFKFYIDKYNSYKNQVSSNLKQKHNEQKEFMIANHNFYDLIEITATTKTPLITGIGQSHPTEVGITLDYNLGIPYIPASTIKGLLRVTTTIQSLNDIDKNKVNVDKKGKYFISDTDIQEVSYYFGGQENSGNSIILDAYPKEVPDLDIDIMNPHYSKYYQGDTPPADYLEPTPIKFLVVKPGTLFIFRILVNKNNKEIKNLKDILIKTITGEGIGAKTAIGYGLFTDIKATDFSQEIHERNNQLKKEKEMQLLENMNETDRYIYELSNFTEQTSDFNKAVEIYNKLDSFNNEDKIKIAKALQEYFKRINKWDRGNEKQINKVKKIKSILKIS